MLHYAIYRTLGLRITITTFQALACTEEHLSHLSPASFPCIFIFAPLLAVEFAGADPLKHGVCNDVDFEQA